MEEGEWVIQSWLHLDRVCMRKGDREREKEREREREWEEKAEGNALQGSVRQRERESS